MTKAKARICLGVGGRRDADFGIEGTKPCIRPRACDVFGKRLGQKLNCNIVKFLQPRDCGLRVFELLCDGNFR